MSGLDVAGIIAAGGTVTLQPDLFGAVSIVGASRTVKALEAEQCLGQTDVYSQLGELLCPSCARFGPHPDCPEGCGA